MTIVVNVKKKHLNYNGIQDFESIRLSAYVNDDGRLKQLMRLV